MSSLGSSGSVPRPPGDGVSFWRHTSHTRLSELTSEECACQTSRPPGPGGRHRLGCTPWVHARRGHFPCPPSAGVSLRGPQPSPRGGSRPYHRSWARGRASAGAPTPLEVTGLGAPLPPCLAHPCFSWGALAPGQEDGHGWVPRLGPDRPATLAAADASAAVLRVPLVWPVPHTLGHLGRSPFPETC